MGTWAQYVAGRDAGWLEFLRPDAVADGARGWRLVEFPLKDGPSAEHAAGRRGPALSAVVMGGDVAIVTAFTDGQVAWDWITDPAKLSAHVPGYEPGPAPADPSAEIDALVAEIVGWCGEHDLTPDAAAVRTCLGSEFAFAQDAFFRLLEVLGVCPGGGPRWLRKDSPGGGPATRVGPWSALPLHHASGNNAGGNNVGDSWERFARRHEVEEWGEPSALLVRRTEHLPTDGSDPDPTATTWEVCLATDPPVWLGTFRGASLEGYLGRAVAGPPEPLATASAGLADLAAAARTRFPDGAGRAPDPGRRPLAVERLGLEGCAEQHPGDEASWYRPAADLRIGLWLDVDPAALTADPKAFVSWLDRARSRVFEPVLAGYTAGPVRYAAGHDRALGGRPYGLEVGIDTESRLGRCRQHAGDRPGWRHLRELAESGDFRMLSLNAHRLNGLGRPSKRPIGEVLVTVPVGPAAGTGSFGASSPGTGSSGAVSGAVPGAESARLTLAVPEFWVSRERVAALRTALDELAASAGKAFGAVNPDGSAPAPAFR